MAEPQVKLSKWSKIVLFYGIAAMLIMVAVDFFTPWSLGTYVPQVLVLVAVTVILLDFMVEKKKDPFRIFGIVIAALAMLGLILNFIGITLVVLTAAQGFVAGLLALFFLVEGFR
ncbi:unnamed protein product [marine sediment metagenome]|uniref:Uncharacterized protein n=1 Tax=marine sediment metagenome TaxID=412755 RepID=X0T0T9_9ZZZZ